MSSIPAPRKTGDQRMDDFFNWVYTVLSNGFIPKITNVATSYTVLPGDFYVGITSTAAARTMTLPPIASLPVRKVYIFKDESGGAGTNSITIDGNSAETIDGVTTKLINSNYGFLRIIKNGSNWFTW